MFSFWNTVEKYCRAGQATDNNTVHALSMLDNYEQRNENAEYIILITSSWQNAYTNAP